jgi:HSP20 family protein
MAFTRWDPFCDLLAMQHRIDRLAAGDAAGWTPPVDVYETPDRFVVTAEVPGLTRDEIHIQAEPARLILHGERTAACVHCEQFHRVERGHGRFSRSFVLPDGIDPDAISADLRDGVLTITIPKYVDRSSRRIQVA